MSNKNMEIVLESIKFNKAGHQAMKNGSYREAIENFKKALELVPGRKWGYRVTS
ncbi:MAG TPA: tetratricopeptide repeat protein [Acidobacteriota bacterium]|nr:tetratricopeptide repeat protein [Acidobacteriota bacterium]